MPELSQSVAASCLAETERLDLGSEVFVYLRKITAAELFREIIPASKDDADEARALATHLSVMIGDEHGRRCFTADEAVSLMSSMPMEWAQQIQKAGASFNGLDEDAEGNSDASPS